MKLNDAQILAVGRGFADYAQCSGLSIWECAILPDHVHLVLARFRLKIERVVIQLKGAATEHLVAENLHPFDGREKCFARGEWKVYLDPPDVPRALKYVADNPSKEGLPSQHWPFVTRPGSWDE